MQYQLGDCVLLYWNGWPQDIEHMWFPRMRFTVVILGSICEVPNAIDN